MTCGVSMVANNEVTSLDTNVGIVALDDNVPIDPLVFITSAYVGIDELADDRIAL